MSTRGKFARDRLRSTACPISLRSEPISKDTVRSSFLLCALARLTYFLLPVIHLWGRWRRNFDATCTNFAATCEHEVSIRRDVAHAIDLWVSGASWSPLRNLQRRPLRSSIHRFSASVERLGPGTPPFPRSASVCSFFCCDERNEVEATASKFNSKRV